jgi:hypothetical protein
VTKPAPASAPQRLLRYALPILATLYLVWVLAETTYRQAHYSGSADGGVTGPPFFTPIPMVWYLVAGALLVGSFMLARSRRGKLAGLCALFAAAVMFNFWLDTIFPNYPS